MSTIKQALNQTNGAGKVRRDIVRFGDGERDFSTRKERTKTLRC